MRTVDTVLENLDVHPETYPKLTAFCVVTPPKRSFGGGYTFVNKSINFAPIAMIQNINHIFLVISFHQKTSWMLMHVTPDAKHVSIRKHLPKNTVFSHFDMLVIFLTHEINR